MTRRTLLQSVFRRISLRTGWIGLDLDRPALIGLLLDQEVPSPDAPTETPIRIDVPITLKRRGVEMRMVLQDDSGAARRRDPALINLVVRAHLYLGQLTDGSGRTPEQVARISGTVPSEISRLLPLAFLSPPIVDAILSGNQPADLTTQRLSRLAGLPRSWNEQAAFLGC